MILCVLLWAHPGQDEALADYEDRVLALMPRHGGRVLNRVRIVDPQDGPTEVQVLEFDAEQGLDTFLADPDRLRWEDVRSGCIDRTEIFRGIGAHV
ncbi:hypothetical protein [Nocardia cyriacigeorgica]|uniref:DUF1330 domain-containing protein n=1 Tax=Nocardia cyriacigeorgica TaxID=135487 RepID=A0A6P1DDB7_9NOCA|nr:hypothetical protein [Nocardia cyriacigeorgica]NEW41448.1 hypothetical protein [Nocardia cyriacigeorgica]NEW46392.1 hypothetical protein [Nocardia cyriacigeorgica]